MIFGEENFIEWAKFIILSKEPILGMNASSISEITGIPRATVIRKLKISEKFGMIFKDKRQLYTIGKSYKAKLKDLGKVFLRTKLICVNLYQHSLNFIEIQVLTKILNKLFN